MSERKNSNKRHSKGQLAMSEKKLAWPSLVSGHYNTQQTMYIQTYIQHHRQGLLRHIKEQNNPARITSMGVALLYSHNKTILQFGRVAGFLLLTCKEGDLSLSAVDDEAAQCIGTIGQPGKAPRTANTWPFYDKERQDLVSHGILHNRGRISIRTVPMQPKRTLEI